MDIHINPATMALGVVAVAGVAAAAQYPEIKRYLKMKAM
jgi:hypothetical protein